MYTSRIVGQGNIDMNPFVFFTLASRSIPFRELVLNPKKEKVNVCPIKEFENHPSNGNLEVDKYACLVTGIRDYSKEPYMVTFNGHMCKRTANNIRDGMPPTIALDSTLFEFRGAPNDARIGSACLIDIFDNFQFSLGMNDIDTHTKAVRGYPNTPKGHCRYIYDKKTELESVFKLGTHNSDPFSLAEYLHKNIIGEEIQFGLGTAVAVYNNGNINVGIFNNNITERKVEEWKKQLS